MSDEVEVWKYGGVVAGEGRYWYMYTATCPADATAAATATAAVTGITVISVIAL